MFGNKTPGHGCAKVTLCRVPKSGAIQNKGRLMGFLAGKRILVTGVLSNRSIAYGIARACRREGAELAFSYVGERFRERTEGFARDFDSALIFDCDVGSDEQIAAMFIDLARSWPKLDGLVHAIGFAPR